MTSRKLNFSKQPRGNAKPQAKPGKQSTKPVKGKTNG